MPELHADETSRDAACYTVSRRRWLRLSSMSLVMASAPAWATVSSTRSVAFSHLHTGETVSMDYFSGGAYVDKALATIDHLLRDFRTGEVHRIDTRLLDMLHTIHSAIGSDAPFQVISGFRSAATNEMLRQGSTGVATRSLHMQGMAIDVRLADTPSSKLREAAVKLGLGGVGYYPASDFVHLDIGRPRQW